MEMNGPILTPTALPRRKEPRYPLKMRLDKHQSWSDLQVSLFLGLEEAVQPLGRKQHVAREDT